MKFLVLFLSACAFSLSAQAKLPAPSEDAKAKAAEAAAKTAHAGKVDAYLLCKSQDRVAAHYRRTGKTSKDAKPVGTPACADPGPYKPPVAATTPAQAGKS
jgi:hypothetical protein